MSRRRGISAKADRTSAPQALNAPQCVAIAQLLPLTPRQAEIVQLILQAKPQKQIAADLRLSPHTVRAYMRQIFARVGVENQMELVLAAFALYLRIRSPITSTALDGYTFDGDPSNGATV